LIGNKSDLEADREVSTREGELLAKVCLVSPKKSQLKYTVIFYWN